MTPLFIPPPLTNPKVNTDDPFIQQPPSPVNNKTAMPLKPLSPERVQNTPRFGQTSVPYSPTLPTIGTSPSRHVRQNSDVQGMVARFNSLDIKDHAELRKRDEAALRRAQMGREEAESELKRFKEEARRLKKEQDEARDRERNVMKRVDVLMEELHRSKEVQQNSQSVYEKEIRRARKEAFKASSTFVKMQQELKATRNQLKVAQADLTTEKYRMQRKDQEAFEAQYNFAMVQDKLNQMCAQVKIVEEERDAIKSSLHEEEVALLAANGRIALPNPSDDDEFYPLVNAKGISTAQQQSSTLGLELEELRAQLKEEVRSRTLAEEKVDFMKLECRFGCCSCRLMESQVSQDSLRDKPIQAQNVDAPEHQMSIHSANDACAVASVLELTPRRSTPVETSALEASGYAFEPKISASPVCPTAPFGSKSAGTIIPITSDVSHQNRDASQIDHPRPMSVSSPSDKDYCSAEKDQHIPGALVKTDSSASVDQKTSDVKTSSVSVRTVTHTTTVPLIDESAPDYSTFFASGTTLTRQEALEMIRERRGRARSVTGTPKRSISVARTPRRDISAPERDKSTKPCSKTPTTIR